MRRALEESKVTFRVEQKKHQQHQQQQGRHRQLLDSDMSDEDLEVTPPSTIRVARNGPSLSASGESSQDPVELDDDDDNDDDNDDTNERIADSGPSLQERLTQRLNKASESAAKPEPKSKPSSNILDLSFSEDEVSPKKTTPAVASKPRFALDDDDSSDDDLLLLDTTLPSRRRKQIQKRMTTTTTRRDDDDSSACSSSGHSSCHSNTVRPKARAPAKKTTAATATRRKTAATTSQTTTAAAVREKERQRLAKQAERDRKAAEKERQKQARAAERHAKKAAAQAEQESKKRRRAQAAQGSGKHAAQEIAILCDSSLVDAIQASLVVETTTNKTTKTTASSTSTSAYLVQDYPSGLGCAAVQFIRKDYVSGGAPRAVQLLHAGNKTTSAFQHLPVFGVVFEDPHSFLALLERNDGGEHGNSDVHDDNDDDQDDDDYPKLELWLKSVETGWNAAWNTKERPRILLFLNNVKGTLDKLWIRYRKKQQRNNRSNPPPTAEELHDAVTWMLIQFQVECIHCANMADVTNHIKKMTRFLAEEPYRKHVTELECVKKLKPQCHDMDPDFDRSRDCWKRQLQQVPGVSHAIASSLVEYYPTARSVWLAYRNKDLTEDQKRGLLADCCGNGRRNTKISDMIYRILTSSDANELLR